ncbi:hypothetical protein [Clostridium saccharobutylicum]|uniref:Flagellar protein FliT n=1 Tax=Clostridium saccharobutylicum TaxID=169679 RepID=A0A1S8NJ49_CLOSA|nr:hypothetical protein [Clostridium saccharobutylicum]OOM16271.1 hypothetical protein CLOSAC_05420 [Clostridium saccharobutylicum]
MIKKIFEEYKEIDLKIINSLKEDKDDTKLLDERGDVVKRIVSSNIDKSELAKIYEDMRLKELDDEIEEVLKEKMDLVKKDIKKLAIGKDAVKGYAATNRSGNFFGAKV